MAEHCQVRIAENDMRMLRHPRVWANKIPALYQGQVETKVLASLVGWE